jgi:hypothetical protein
VAPSDEALDIFKPLRARDRRRRTTANQDSVNVGNVQQGPSFSFSEFGRLVCVLLQVDTVRKDLIASGADLSRAQDDRREERDSLWSHSVESSFNDASCRVRLDADGHVANVDVNAAPLEYRTGDKLKRIFFKARALFTTLYARWTVSGQNDPETFVNYLPTAPRSPEISTEGKRAHILFIAMSCGTLEEDADALNFTKKTVPDGVGYDYMNDQIVCEVREVRPSKRSRCTTAPQDDALHQFSDILVETLQPLLSVVSVGAVGGSSGAL